MYESTLSVAPPQLILPLFGARDQHLQMLRDRFGVSITHREDQVRIAGPKPAVLKVTEALEWMKRHVERRGSLDRDEVAHLVERLAAEDGVSAPPIETMTAGKSVTARTPGQARYIQAIRENELVIAVGPAGCGKTYLAVAVAVEALKQRTIRKIVLVRPAVEAGESLGFLPGDLQAKINPYLRPLMDALHEMIDHDQIKRLMEQDIIEIIPLAYMRGRTLNEAFIILDEAQNTTVAQMKMFLTRMGADSRIVVSGDVTQVDLPMNKQSGLIDAIHRLSRIRGVAEIHLGQADIVRHRLVQDIVAAYDRQLPPSRAPRE